MISFSTLLISVVVAGIFYFLFKRNEKKLNFPPGPSALPFVGNALQLKDGFHLKICEWTAKYGDIMSFKIGPNRAIMISDPKLLREAYNDLNFSGRPYLESVTLVSGGPRGLINSTGKEWEEQRRWALRHLRDFGFGKNSMESTIMDQVNELLEGFKNVEGESVDLSKKFSLAALNVLWKILVSTRYKQDDPRLLHILSNNTLLTEKLTSSPLLLLPALAKLAPSLTGWNSIIELVEDVQKFVREGVQEHKDTFSQGEHRDFMDAYIHEMNETKDPSSSFYKDLGEANLRAVVQDLFAAGSETTSVTLNYTILLLSKFDHVQLKVHKELDDVIGQNRQPCLSDRPNLPYCTAVMEEVLRFNSLIPSGLFHMTLADTKFHGYDIPKGTWVGSNHFWIHYNPQYFKNPTEFNPSRFLSEDGKTFKKNENVFAFSTGKRVCLGETLARDEYFLFFTSIFQKFQIRLADEYKDMSVIGKPGFILTPPTFQVVMKDRQNT